MSKIHSMVPNFLRIHPVFLPVVVVFIIAPWTSMTSPIEPILAFDFWLRVAISGFWFAIACLLLTLKSTPEVVIDRTLDSKK